MAPDSRLDKISEDRPNIFRAFFNRRNISGLAGAAVVGPGLHLGAKGAVTGYILFRWVYSKTEQYVPFTKRRHVILMPSVAESMLGAHLYETFLIEQHKKGALLDSSHPDTSLVQGVAQRLIAVLQQGHGGGYQKHLRNFRWSVSVVKEPVMNAFVFPGGYIVVYTGLLQLLRRDADLLAMVLGHEIAHALARHNTEKMGMGLAVSLVTSMALAALGAAGADQQQREQRQQQLEYERMRRGYHRTHSRLVYEQLSEQQQQQPWGGGSSSNSRAPGGAAAAAAGGGYYPSVPSPHLPPIDWQEIQRQQQQRGRQSEPKPVYGGGAGGEPPVLPSWMSEQLLRSLSNVLLELPFSRRAETEADLIGIKLMALAGFNPNKGPEAFRLLASVSDRSGKGGAESLIAGLGCTHPDSSRRAELLAKELQWMAQQPGEAAREGVGSKVDYWSL